MKKSFSKQSWTILILLSALGIKAADHPISTILLPAAIAGRPYSYQISTTASDGAPVTFAKIDGWTAIWLRVSPSGLLEGTPDKTAPARSTIRVRAESRGGSQLTALFVVPVETVVCPHEEGGELAWCEPAPNSPAGQAPANVPPPNQAPVYPLNFQFKDVPFKLGAPVAKRDLSLSSVKVIQFSRVTCERGMFGHYQKNQIPNIAWDEDPRWVTPELVSAVNGSKVPISGSVLVKSEVPYCSMQKWNIVTESVDSSSILVYGPSEISVFCHPDASANPDSCPRCGTLLIVLPVHAIWANVFGHGAETHDPGWKPVGDVAAGYDCEGNPMKTLMAPPQGIRPCDSRSDAKIRPPLKTKSNLATDIFYSPVVAWVYNRLTQPGVTQGTFSFAPVDRSPKWTFDGQSYVSTRIPGGWIGLTTMLEHDINPKDDLDSFTAAVTYDWRWGDNQRFLGSKRDPGADPPYFGLRVPEFSVRLGPEAMPGARIKGTDSARELNLVGGGTARLPMIFSFLRQPSIISVLPLVGWEGGKRIDSHQIGTMPPPRDISRFLTGIDASARWPYYLTHNFLGDRPITLDYSYRYRHLFSPEPYIDANSPMESSVAGSRAYNRITLIMPFSAYLQLRASWQRGTLPPEFQYAGDVFTLGLAFSNPGSVEH